MIHNSYSRLAVKEKKNQVELKLNYSNYFFSSLNEKIEGGKETILTIYACRKTAEIQGYFDYAESRQRF